MLCLILARSPRRVPMDSPLAPQWHVGGYKNREENSTKLYDKHKLMKLSPDSSGIYAEPLRVGCLECDDKAWEQGRCCRTIDLRATGSNCGSLPLAC
ncbi:hypothetical protein Leryth_008558 [Lithospermum erythrorhizon]|nr:hypothetical protein Leryth_008558 [Lithospermum erythrorhizon]